MTRYTDDLGLAHLLADTADAISLSRFRALDLRVDAKPDLSPVTDADTAVEKAVRSTLARSRPRDGVLGEEFGSTPAAAGPGNRQWVIDPIDGTKNFVRGVPIWATLISLLEGGEPVLGLVSAPALGRRWWAARGHGAFAGKHASNATRIHVSEVGKLSDASFCYSSLGGWEEAGKLDAMLDLMRGSWRSRAYGDFYGHMLLAEGAVDAMVEAELALWDMAALIPIITEAGGRCTNRAGRPLNHGDGVIMSNGQLHEVLLDHLGD
ncbi:histidinol-phosphatase [Longispora albida]|uniref:histidinol-phosphatase n=1 Tax=Longispora albida TaxID=203523 RepID=UPI000370456F|nr:histidinol-phosphatase [Longispora albida]